jgi:glucose dehydrogenase
LIISTKIDTEASILKVKIDAQTGHIIRGTMMVAVQKGFPCGIGLLVGLPLIGRPITVNLSLISLCRGEACSGKSLEGLIRRIVW